MDSLKLTQVYIELQTGGDVPGVLESFVKTFALFRKFFGITRLDL
jgi:hypothetical protein